MLTINAKPREKEKNDYLRKNKVLPAVVYGKDLKGLPLKVEYSVFNEAYKEAGESTIINLKIDGKKEEYPVLIREVQKDSLSGDYLHADFYQLPMNEEVEVTVPLEFEGEAPAEKELGGVLIRNIHEVEIKALPKDLLHSIKVDISSLKTFEDEIKIKDLKLSTEAEILADQEAIVALVGKVEEEKIEEEPEAEKEKIEEIEVIKEKKEGEEEPEVEEEQKKEEQKNNKK